MRAFTIAAAAATTLASFADSLAIRDNSTTSGNSVELFHDDSLNGQGIYAASIASVCKDQTVYALQCTSAKDDSIGIETCGPDAPILTVTQAPSVYKLTYVTATRTLGHDAQVSFAESCDLTGTTKARCDYTVGLTMDGTSNAATFATVLSGTDLHRFQVAITGGAEKTRLASATDVCGNAAAGLSANSVRVTAAALAVGLLGVLVL
ncbi:predicted protein [Chaetomium globosum CBS 148.51]|uniref:Uncharacterized protein n=1 Tax=Chaetomium globosum (strain ATCC 6205 / CBS 148.51 / DSM 1962 / NBRC 6347 / NRRL 1970) TaxID=306901 RepID=Q2GQH2_CHAGB|nr:uncharacterized protein CHGG_09782 [Chaetomium globosum CBS 148.51]EAQ83378.1 predicted protein [Chaetomium globosum CBS 148.51]